MKNKTICFFNSTKAWGGGEKWHFDMSSALNLEKKNVIVFTNTDSALHNKLQSTKVKTVAVKISNLSFLNPFKIFKLKRLFRENNVGTIIMNLSVDLKVAGFAAKLSGIDKIIYRRGSAIPIKDKFLNRFIFKNILTEVIANTEATKKTILENNHNLIDDNKITVIYNGIKIKTSTKKLDAIISQANGIILGNAGRLAEQKGQKYLIELAKILKGKGLNFTLFIAGIGELTETIKNLIKKNNLEKEVILLGFVEDVNSFMNSLDIFILSSIWEGFGYVIAEAMAAKKPVIAFNLSSNPELIDNNKTGYLVDFKNIEDMASKTIELAKNEILRKEMGENGFAKVNNQFTIDKSYKNLINMLNC